jgi:hypothetical protein
MKCVGCETKDAEIKRLKRLCWDMWLDLDEVRTVVVHASQSIGRAAHQMADETMRSFLRERIGDAEEP